LQQLGYAGRSSDTPEDKQKRADLFRVLGNVGNDPEVIQQARAMVQEYMKDTTSIDPTLAGAVVSVAARNGDTELYNQYKAQLQKVKSPQLYYRFFYGLAEFPQQPLIQQTLQSTLTPEVRGQDLFIVVNLLANPISQNATWDFMRQNFNEIMKKTGGGLGGVGVFLYGAESFCTTQQAQEVKQFFDQHPFPGTERNQREAIESINGCVELRDQQRNNLAAWLKQNGNTNASTGGGTATVGTRR
jgi:puromycin-sensitive aminopeptidase